MTVKELCEKLSLKVIVEGDGFVREITGGYTGDLLSWVMSRAQSGDAWITVMSNINVIAVASLTDTACVILAEGAVLDPAALSKAEAEGITVLGSDMPAFELIKLLEI